MPQKQGTNKQGTSLRKAQTAKIGKRHGMINFPLPPNPEKRAASELGEQQFIAKTQQYMERSRVKYDRAKQRFINKIVQVPVDYTYDPTRGRLVKSPVNKEKKAQ